MVGLIPLFAIDTMEPEMIEKLPGFRRRMEWFMKHRPDLATNVASLSREGIDDRRLLSVLVRSRLERVLHRLSMRTSFFRRTGFRSVSRFHADHPFRLTMDGHEYGVQYEPAESQTGLFGGNCELARSGVFPVNYLLIEALQR